MSDQTFMESMGGEPLPPVPEIVPHRISVDTGDGIWWTSAPVFDSMEQCAEAIRDSLSQAVGTQISNMMIPLEDGRFMIIPAAALHNCIFVAEPAE